MARKVSAAAFAAFLKERVSEKDGYIFGTLGQNPKKLSDWYFAGQYRGQQLKKALYWRENARRVWDCNGLAEGYYQEMTGVSINARARDNYNRWCETRGAGLIPAAYRKPGAAVFMKSSQIHHVGFLEKPVDANKPEGDWYVIEARGVMHGVVRTRLKSRGWNLWGLMTKYFDYGSEAQESGDGALGDRLLKRGSRGEDVRQLQAHLLELGYALPEYGLDGDFGSETEAALEQLQAALDVECDGRYGDETHAALMAALEKREDDAPETEIACEQIRITAARSAYVRLGPSTTFGVLTVVRRGMTFESSATANNGWRCISVNGRMGWISPKLCEGI